jgi:hypothetical protein
VDEKLDTLERKRRERAARRAAEAEALRIEEEKAQVSMFDSLLFFLCLKKWFG